VSKLEDALSDALRSCAELFRPEEAVDARDRFLSRLRRRRAVQTGGGVALAAAAAVLIFVLVRPASVDRRTLPAAAQPRIAARFTVGDGPRGVLVSSGAVWVTNRSDGTLTEVDIASGEARTIRPLRGVDSAPVAVASWRGFLFFTDAASGMLVPADPRTGSVPTQNPVGPGPGDVVTTDGGVWVASRAAGADGGAVWLSAPSSEEEGSDAPEIPVVATFASRPEIAAARRVVWAASGGEVVGLRIRGDEVVRGTPVEVGSASDIAAAARSVWVVTEVGSLVRIDAAAGEVTGRADLGLPPGGQVAMSGSAVWVVGGIGGRGELVHVDADSLEVRGRLALEGGPFSIAAAGRTAWVTDAAGDVLLRIEPPD
jgi:hypothetical protein